MNPQEIIKQITDERMEHIRRFPADLQLIEQEVAIAVADGMQAALEAVQQEIPWSDKQ